MPSRTCPSRPELKPFTDPGEQVLAEAARDYELLVLGETHRGNASLFGPMATGSSTSRRARR